jgi:hypothetical protein
MPFAEPRETPRKTRRGCEKDIATIRPNPIYEAEEGERKTMD